MLIERPQAIRRVAESFRAHPAVAIVGPRQCGKSTLARMLAANEPEVAFFDLERAVDRRRLQSPEQALAPLTGLVVIDEIQRQPALFETLRVLLDRPDSQTRFLLLGSASPALTKNASETLAGRMGWVDLSGFDISEVCPDGLGGATDWRILWRRGGFPRSYLAPDDSASALWRDDFLRIFLERDVPQLGISIPADALRRFWTMVARYTHAIFQISAQLASGASAQFAGKRRDVAGLFAELNPNKAYRLAKPPIFVCIAPLF